MWTVDGVTFITIELKVDGEQTILHTEDVSHQKAKFIGDKIHSKKMTMTIAKLYTWAIRVITDFGDYQGATKNCQDYSRQLAKALGCDNYTALTTSETAMVGFVGAVAMGMLLSCLPHEKEEEQEERKEQRAAAKS